MTNQTTFTTVADNDQLSQGYFNSLLGELGTNAVICAMNASASATNYHVVSDLLGASTTAASSTNWTYAAGEWDNKQTSAATLQFNNLMSSEQKLRLAANNKTVVLYVDYLNSGDVDTTTVGNASFETAGGGGADVFANWTETTAGAAHSFTRATGTGVTAGTYCCKFAKSASSDNTQVMGSVSQSVDFTNLKTIYYDAQGSSTSPNVSVRVYVDSTQVSETSATTSWTDTNKSCDVSSYTGSHTLKFEFYAYSGPGTSTISLYVDNIRCLNKTSAHTTRTYSVSYDGGTNWATVTPGTPYTFANQITNLGAKIVETNTDATTLFYNRILGFGVYFV